MGGVNDCYTTVVKESFIVTPREMLDILEEDDG